MKIILTFTLIMMIVDSGALSFTSVTGYSGDKVNITCTYDRYYTRNYKYFCRRSEVFTETCSDLIRTDVKDRWVQKGRFSLYDDTTASVFTVIITDLNEQDSDTYYCAVDLPLSLDLYTEVNLTVREVTSHHKTSPPTQTTTCLSTFSSVQFTPISSSSSSSTSSFSSPKSVMVTSASPVTSSGSSLIISLCVVLVLIITGLLMLMVIICKRHQTPVDISHSRPGNNERVSRASCDYTEINDIIRQDDVCRNKTLLNTIYATAQFPTIPSDYSTVKQPVNDGQSDGLNYTTVSFHNKSDDNQDYSEYSVINHATV